MATLVGHVCGAFAAYSIAKYIAPSALNVGIRGWLLTGILAITPDLDVILLILFPDQFRHRGFSHSFLFAFACALVFAFLFPWKGFLRYLQYAPLLFLVTSSHVFLDYLMGYGPKVMFFWPFSAKGWLSPIQLVPTAYYSHSFSGLKAIFFSKRNFINYSLEGMSFIPIAVFFIVMQKPVSLLKILGGVILSLISVIGFYLTYIRYN